MSIATATVPVPLSGTGALVDVSAMVGPKTVVLSGTFRGLYDLQASHDDVNFVSVLQFDAGGVEGVRRTMSGAFKSVRLSAATPDTTPVTPVTCIVSGILEDTENTFASIATVAPNFTGLTPTVDTSVAWPPSGPEADACFICTGGFQGIIVVLGSNNGVDFSPIGSFRVDRSPDGSPSQLKLPVVYSKDAVRYVRLQVDAVVTSTTVVTMGGWVGLPSVGPDPPTCTLQIPRNIVYPAPLQRRYFRYWKVPPDPDPGFSAGVKILVVNLWQNVLEETFVTGPLSCLLKLTISLQATIFAGVNPFAGLLMRCTVIQGATEQRAPGCGDSLDFFFSRRDTAGNGGQLTTSYSTAVELAPNTVTTVRLEFKTTDTDAYVSILGVVADY
jgi:hypothetical protein